MMYMMAPPVFHKVTRDSAGKEVARVALQFSPQVEECPDLDGYLQLRARKKGSPLRLGRSYVAVGYDRFTMAAGAGTTLDLQDNVQEPGWLGFMIIGGIPAGSTLVVTQFLHRGDSLLSGEVPAQMFSEVSFHSPPFGHYFTESTKMELTLFNFGAAALTVSVGFTLF